MVVPKGLAGKQQGPGLGLLCFCCFLFFFFQVLRLVSFFGTGKMVLEAEGGLGRLHSITVALCCHGLG